MYVLPKINFNFSAKSFSFGNLSLLITGNLQNLSRAAVSNRNCLPSQKLCHYLNQGRTLNDILMTAAHSNNLL